MRYLIISGKEALNKQIGNTKEIEAAIKKYIKSKPDYDIKFLYYDQNNIFKVRKTIKTAAKIQDFVCKIEAKWGNIDFLMLLGGDDVIPFFRLQNPCDDEDNWVCSDNPYASRDDDYLIPERACSRIPDNSSAEFMIKQLSKPVTGYQSSFGLTAKIWKKASVEVFRMIGDKKKLKISPPVSADNFDEKWLQSKRYLYFNVHGSKVASNWYGQDNNDYPVALSIGNVEKACTIVMSEACYGANILNKGSDNALCLHFLDQAKTAAFCGSTTIAYGPAEPPSGEADLLAKYFFEYTDQGLTTGEALKNAKVDLARKVLRMNGFLDDDDQKTLLQFVLYGDVTYRIKKKIEREK